MVPYHRAILQEQTSPVTAAVAPLKPSAQFDAPFHRLQFQPIVYSTMDYFTGFILLQARSTVGSMDTCSSMVLAWAAGGQSVPPWSSPQPAGELALLQCLEHLFPTFFTDIVFRVVSLCIFSPLSPSLLHSSFFSFSKYVLTVVQ